MIPVFIAFGLFALGAALLAAAAAMAANRGPR